MKISFGILTVSDSCYDGKASDKSGPSLVHLVTSHNEFSGDVVCKIIPDEQENIENVLKHWCDDEPVDVILTTGGTGFSPRDVTPEATRNVITREASGITIAMMKASLDITPMAMLSRGVTGVRGRTLIINLPGSVKGALEMATAALPGIPHAVALMRGDDRSVRKVHSELHGGHHHCRHAHNHAESKVDLSQVARRARESPYPMKEVGEAINIMLREVKGLASPDTKTLSEALGHVTLEAVRSADDLPPFPASVKDGYAVITADGVGLRQVVGNSFAGNQSRVAVLQPGQCMRVTTGAPVPPGADAVVQVEDTQLTKEADGGKTEIEIKILEAPSVGQDIRPVGSDMRKGEVVVEQGTLLHPSHIGLIAAAGVSQVKVFRLPRVAVLSTGDEVMDAGSAGPARPGCIYDSNRPMLLALFRQHGFPTTDMGIIRDDPGAVLGKLREALGSADVVVTSGGVSMGERDYLKEVLLKDLGAHIHFGRVQMKPGKPTTFATCEHQGKKKLVFALPGNPVSTAVTCHLFTLPALRALAGQSASHGQFTVTAKLGSEVRLDPRPEYCRAQLDWPTPSSQELPTAHLTGKQMSSRLMSMQTATALLVLPPACDKQKTLAKGALVSAILINSPY